MIDYKNLEVIYTIEWPFNHWKLDSDKFISEIEAKGYFEGKEYFQAVYLNDNHRIFCIDFEINFVRFTLYEDGNPMYEYLFILLANGYYVLKLKSVREKNVECVMHEDGNAYIVERSSLLGKDKKYKKRCDHKICKPIQIDFNQYEDLLEFVEDISINKLLI